MCGIFGWNNSILTESEIDFVISQTQQRGRDGWGFSIDGKEIRGLSEVPSSVMKMLYKAKKVVGNFRATPTTEAESLIANLQPYNGIVHNGTIANDKDIADFAIDSMALKEIFKDSNDLISFTSGLTKIVGSFAVAFFRLDRLYVGLNYKPLYFHRNKKGIVFASQSYMIPRDSIAFKPYTANEITKNNINTISLPRKQSNQVLVSASAGLDSTTVAYFLKDQGYEVTLVHFLYGCLAEKREIEKIKAIADHGNFSLMFLEMPRNVMAGSLLENKFLAQGVAGSEYAYDWVSARNLLMLAMLTAAAETKGFGYISIGNNLEEAGAYPDNEEEFGNLFNKILPFSTQNGVKVELLQPMAKYMKHEIVKIGLKLKVPFELTWSCYSNQEKHCGTCAPCFMRRTAFYRNGALDPVF
jgi:7-cyano-7-deazaguanine synthase